MTVTPLRVHTYQFKPTEHFEAVRVPLVQDFADRASGAYEIYLQQIADWCDGIVGSKDSDFHDISLYIEDNEGRPWPVKPGDWIGKFPYGTNVVSAGSMAHAVLVTA